MKSKTFLLSVMMEVHYKLDKCKANWHRWAVIYYAISKNWAPSKKMFFFNSKIYRLIPEESFCGSVMERQINFKPFPDSSRNAWDEPYIHMQYESLIRIFSWYKVGALKMYAKSLAMKILTHPNNPGAKIYLIPNHTMLICPSFIASAHCTVHWRPFR